MNSEAMIEAGLVERDKGDHGSDADLLASVYLAMRKHDPEIVRLRQALECASVTLRLDRERMIAKGMSTLQNEEAQKRVDAALTNSEKED